MTQDQVEFFGRLCAPFAPSQVKVFSQGGKTMHYVGRGTLMNRLDNVAGPGGWTAEYRESHEKAYFCALTITVPDGHGGFEGITKEDCGGVSDMKDAGDNEKSGATSAFKRACEAWGIGRYLRGDGVPEYLGDQQLPDIKPSQFQQPRWQSQGPAQSQPQGQRQYDLFRLPKRGKALFPWSKNLEEHFKQTGIVDILNGYGKSQGFAYSFKDWTDEQAEVGARHAAGVIATWDCYEGEFDQALGGTGQAPQAGGKPNALDSQRHAKQGL